MKVGMLKAVALAVGLAGATTALADSYLIKDVRVFDGKKVHAKRSVLLDGGKIVSADFKGKAPAGAKVVEGAGRTLMPGLIDSHVHAYRYVDLPLLFGVTTQVDMFTSVPTMQDMSGRMQRGQNKDRADLFSAGQQWSNQGDADEHDQDTDADRALAIGEQATDGGEWHALVLFRPSVRT